MLEIVAVNKAFKTKTALQDINLRIEAGAFVGVVGRSGAGKSTLLRAINRLGDPTSGKILWNGEDVTAFKGAALRNWRITCGMIFQQFNLSNRLDVLTNVMMGRLGSMSTPRAVLKLWTQDDKALALSALEQFGLGSAASQRAGSLSGGQQQRVAIARTLLQQPKIILADEPIASLDPRNTKLVMDALQRINRHLGITVICNLHSLDLARSYCTRLIGMADGRVVFDGAPETLTDAVARGLYGTEAHGVVDVEPAGEGAGAGATQPVAA
ncbi:MAG: phosphonate ABC transporter ATP-binding protein [Alphaproteobacteria bacterium]|nr:phosphonate ABC transporter ATP-binding protein [Alphaproteobacteria bacterium]